MPRLQQPLAFWLWLSHTCLSASNIREGPVYSQPALLWYLLNPLFCQQARLCIRAFHGKVLSLSLSLSLFFPSLPQFGLLSHVVSLSLSSRHSGLVLTLRTDYAAHTSLSSPHLLVTDVSVWTTSPLAVVVRSIFCGGFCFFPPSYVAL